jgi:hypothetical protein
MSISPAAYRPMLPAQIEGIGSVLIQEVQPYVARCLQLASPTLQRSPENQLRGELEDCALYLPSALKKAIAIAETDGRKVQMAQVLAATTNSFPLVTGGLLLYTSRTDGSPGTSHDLILTRDLGLTKGLSATILAAVEYRGGEVGDDVSQRLPDVLGLHSIKGSPKNASSVGIYRMTEAPEQDTGGWVSYRLASRLERNAPEVAVAANSPSLADLFRKHRGSAPIVCAAPNQTGIFERAQKAGIRRIGVEMTQSQYRLKGPNLENTEKKLGLEMVPLLDDQAFERDAPMLESRFAMNAAGRYDVAFLEDNCDRLDSIIRQEEMRLMNVRGFIPPNEGLARSRQLEEMKAQLARLKGPVRRYIERIGADPAVYQQDLERFWETSAREMADRMRGERLDMVVVIKERATRLAELLKAPYYEE